MYNAVQKLLYIFAILAGVSQVVTGLAIWKPVQFSGLVSLLGGFQTARVIHFAGMAGLVGFLIVHVLLALLVPQTLVGHADRRPARRSSGDGRAVTSDEVASSGPAGSRPRHPGRPPQAVADAGAARPASAAACRSAR